MKGHRLSREDPEAKHDVVLLKFVSVWECFWNEWFWIERFQLLSINQASIGRGGSYLIQWFG